MYCVPCTIMADYLHYTCTIVIRKYSEEWLSSTVHIVKLAHFVDIKEGENYSISIVS